MKKSLLAFAVAAALPIAAQAQVTLFGVFDMGYRDTGDGTQISGAGTKMASGQWAGPRVGVRGSSDIGGGLKANFHVESAIGYLGTANWDTSRGAFAGLSGGFGRVDFGSRILSPTFWAAAAIDPTGQSGLTITPYGGIGPRIDRAIYYTSNSLSGLIVRAAVQTSDDNTGTTASATASAAAAGKSALDASAVYTAGPLTVALGFGDNGTNDGMSIGASYDLKVANIRVRYVDSDINLGASLPTEAVVVGATVPFGKATAFIDYLNDQSAAKINKALAGVSYELGKNTFVYGYVRTTDKTDDVIGVGLRHSF